MFSKLVNNLLYDQLVTTDINFNPEPMLAQDWSVNQAADQWKFRIRDGAMFHDGSPVTSRDVAATFRRVLDPDVGARGYSQLAGSLEPSGIETPDNTTLVLNLSRPNALLARTLGGNTSYFSVIPADSNENDPLAGVGSGPFRLESFEAGTQFSVVKNEDYWGEEPYLDGVSAFAVDQESTKVQSVVGGDAQLCDPISYSETATVGGAAEILQVPNGVYLDIAMDITQAPFDDPRVMEAIKLAVNRQQVVDVALGGYGEITADVPVGPSHPYFPPSLEVSADGAIEKARELLTDAGYADGIDIEINTADVTGGMVDLAVVFANVVEPAGIRAKVQQHPSNSYFEDVFLQVPAFVSYWSSRPTVDLLNQIYSSDSSSNESNWRSEEFDDLLAEAAATVNEDEQTKLVQDAIALLGNNAGTIIPAISPYLWVKASNLRGVEPGVSGTVDIRRAYLA